MDLRRQVESFLVEHDPAAEERLEFLPARFDAGLAWVGYSDGLGGRGQGLASDLFTLRHEWSRCGSQTVAPDYRRGRVQRGLPDGLRVHRAVSGAPSMPGSVKAAVASSTRVP